ncbi:5'-3' exonuclease H3TH domain-containing protein, partial [Bacillus pumilus]|uniref:5'-3' exonuclease H3TH domain-containing protein n=1 Tax=Bacillus pumilus TaxID=1408 RepID=UPI0028CB813E
MKGVMGDGSDNYGGVKGMGEKRGLKFIERYKWIEGLLENVDELRGGEEKKME